jgi:hypothetical protein
MYSAASVTKILHLKAYKLSIVQGAERWMVHMPVGRLVRLTDFKGISGPIVYNNGIQSVLFAYPKM